MLYLLYGKDSFRVGQKLNELLSFFRSKAKGVQVLDVDEENFNQAEIEGAIKSRTLFERRHIIVCRRFMKRKDSSDFVSRNLKNFSLSENVFLLLEEDLDDEALALFKKDAGKIQCFNPLSGIELRKWVDEDARKRNFNISQEERNSIIFQCGPDLARTSQEIEKLSLSPFRSEKDNRQIKGALEDNFNIFQICDAFASKNKTKVWILFQQALLRGVSAEEIFWKLWWQVKNLLLVEGLLKLNVKNLQKESGLHPFVVKKTLSALRNFTGKELSDSSLELVKLYHNARKGEADFGIGMEKFLIK